MTKTHSKTNNSGFHFKATKTYDHINSIIARLTSLLEPHECSMQKMKSVKYVNMFCSSKKVLAQYQLVLSLLFNNVLYC